MRRAPEDMVPTALRRQIMMRDRFACHYCGAKKRLSVDHKIPVSQGGSTEAENLVIACKSCNSKKGSRSYEIVKDLDRSGVAAMSNRQEASDEAVANLINGGDLLDYSATITLVRDQLGISRDEFAHSCGVSRRTAEGWDMGREPQKPVL